MADFSSYLLLLLLLFWLSYFLFLRSIFTRTRPNDPGRHPPSPRSLPVIGHLHLLGRIPHQSLHKLSCQYGPLMHLFFGSKPCLVVSSPEMAKEFLKNHESSFLNRPIRTNINYLTYGSADFTFAPYGPYWKFLKKLCMTELLGGRTLDLHHPVREDETRLFLQRIRTRALAGAAIDVGAELSRFVQLFSLIQKLKQIDCYNIYRSILTWLKSVNYLFVNVNIWLNQSQVLVFQFIISNRFLKFKKCLRSINFQYFFNNIVSIYR